MGTVYRARQLALQRTVALKVISSGPSQSAEQRARFTTEAQLAASIDHPNVVPVHEAGEADGLLFIAMRLIEGTDLKALVERAGALAPERAVAIVEQTAGGLDAAHRRGLVHRDVKPANILLDADERAFLTDFGLSKLTSGAESHTRTGMFVGTPDFIAPEQIRGEPADQRSDVYALGCVLVWTLTAATSFGRDSETATFFAHLESPPPVPSVLVHGIPAALDAVVARAMAKVSTERYRTCLELAEAARAALLGPPVPSGVAPGPETASVPEERRPRRKRRAREVASEATVAGPAGWSRRRRLALAGTPSLLLVAGLTATAIAVLAGGEGGGAGPGGPSIRATIKVGDGPDGIAVADGKVFVANRHDGSLSRIDRVNNREFPERIRLGLEPDAVVAAKNVVWVADGATNALQRLDGKVDVLPTATVPIGRGAQAISLGVQLVWVANTQDDTVNRIDRATPQVIGPPIGVGSKPTGISVGSSVWVSNHGSNTVTRIDRATATVVGAPIPVGRKPRGILEADGSVWVVNSGSNSVTRLDAATGKVLAKAIPVGRNPREVAFGFGTIWVTNFNDDTVSRIDARTGRALGVVAVGRSPLHVATGPDSVWVTNFRDDTVSRIRP